MSTAESVRMTMERHILYDLITYERSFRIVVSGIGSLKLTDIDPSVCANIQHFVINSCFAGEMDCIIDDLVVTFNEHYALHHIIRRLVMVNSYTSKVCTCEAT